MLLPDCDGYQPVLPLPAPRLHCISHRPTGNLRAARPQDYTFRGRPFSGSLTSKTSNSSVLPAYPPVHPAAAAAAAATGTSQHVSVAAQSQAGPPAKKPRIDIPDVGGPQVRAFTLSAFAGPFLALRSLPLRTLPLPFRNRGVTHPAGTAFPCAVHFHATQATPATPHG